MRILHNYVTKEILTSFFFALIVFTLVLFLGNILRLVEFIVRGVGLIVIFKFMLYIIPSILTHSIAMALLTSVLITFGKLSVDNELTAMRSSGIRMARIVFPVISIAILLSIACIYLNNYAQPYCHFNLKKLKAQIGVKNPANLIKSGTFIDEFPPYLIYIGEKERNKFTDIVIHEIKPNNTINFIKANSGELVTDLETHELTLKLYNGALEEPDSSSGHTIHGNFSAYIVSLGNSEMTDISRLKKSTKDKTTKELVGEKMLFKEKLKKATPDEKKIIRKRISFLETRIQERLSFALACLAFTLIGIPLGIKSHRKEKSIGVAIALLLVLVHYGFTLLANALEELPQFYPAVIMQSPNIILSIVGIYLIYRVSRT
ncbi:MAG: LptF/LptG family permease [Candidatus Ancaeobacter aquaticus]|nr:LptF/LptG family permease [Candidatus Ancaeobacter aquaticus]